jgi:protein TonB
VQTDEGTEFVAWLDIGYAEGPNARVKATIALPDSREPLNCEWLEARLTGQRIPAGSFGAGAYRVGGGISPARPLVTRNPAYTPEAQRAKIQGEVEIECVVLEDGSVGDARITRSLDPGLDLEALKALRASRFAPATNAAGAAVRSVGTMVFTFKIH